MGGEGLDRLQREIGPVGEHHLQISGIAGACREPVQGEVRGRSTVSAWSIGPYQPIGPVVVHVVLDAGLAGQDHLRHVGRRAGIDPAGLGCRLAGGVDHHPPL